MPTKSVSLSSAVRTSGFVGFGVYPRSGSIHVDLRLARQWGERCPVRSVSFAAQTPPARDGLSLGRTVKGGGAAGYGAIPLTIVLFLLSIRRDGERVGRIAERREPTEKANEIQRRVAPSS